MRHSISTRRILYFGFLVFPFLFGTWGVMNMRKTFALALTVAVAAFGAPLGVLAAAPAGQATGSVTGVAKDAAQKALPKVKVQVRGANGQLAASGTTNATGAFTVPGLAPGSYTIEVLDAAGNIVGTSTAVTITAGSVATVTVTAAAAGAIAAAAGGGVSILGLGTLGSVAVIGAAGAATIGAIAATRNDASPSR
jgi:hypothetical protein